MCLETMLVEHGSPTLAGLKTANLFTVRTSGEDITAEVRRVNRILFAKGIRVIPVRKREKSVLLYVYRPDRLRQDLLCPEAACILKDMGYPCGEPEKCLARLVRQLAEDGEFPHEVGLFLGYPPSDVKGFMESPRHGFKCCGCWKAYSNQEEAEKTFDRYKRCTYAYKRQLMNGMSLEKLAV